MEKQEQLKQIKALIVSGQQENIDIAEELTTGLGFDSEIKDFTESIEAWFYTLEGLSQLERGEPIVQVVRLTKVPLNKKVQHLLKFDTIYMYLSMWMHFEDLDGDIAKHLNINELQVRNWGGLWFTRLDKFYKV